MIIYWRLAGGTEVDFIIVKITRLLKKYIEKLEENQIPKKLNNIINNVKAYYNKLTSKSA